jgi:hypothetical protein
LQAVKLVLLGPSLNRILERFSAARDGLSTEKNYLFDAAMGITSI